MNEKINNFAFKGLLAKYCIKDLQGTGFLKTPEQTEQEKKDHDLFVSASEKNRSASLVMQRIYRLLYVFENEARDFIVDILIEEYGEDWFEKIATSDMKKKFSDRKKLEEKNSWHIGRNKEPIFYLDFGDLELLIKNNWDLFKSFFPDQNWVTTRIQETERTRNVIAHTNILSAEEGARLEMYFKDWIRQIG